MNTNYSALPLTSPSIELQSNGTKSSAATNGVVLNGHAKISKQDSFLGELEDGGGGGEHDELPLIGDGPAGPPEGSTVPAAVFNLATSIIGAGIMALPATMKVLGVAVGLVAILVMGVLSEITVELLVRFSAHCRALSYGEVVHRALGRPASIVAQRGEREVRGRKDISRASTNCAPACSAVVSCHVGKSDKNIGAAATIILNI